MKSTLCYLALSLSTLATAGEPYVSYQTRITHNDRTSSTGTALTSPAEILRQDRANVHKLGNPDGDAADVFFTTPERRSGIPALLKRGSLAKPLADKITRPGDISLLVTLLMESDGTLSMEIVESGPPPNTTPASDEVRDAKPGSDERKQIMDAMRRPVMIHTKVPVLFTGDVKICGRWAKFEGHVGPAVGATFGDDLAFERDLDFLAVLKLVDAKWTVGYYGWSGDISTSIAAREKLPEVPHALIPEFAR
jgi:hypothetical protein